VGKQKSGNSGQNLAGGERGALAGIENQKMVLARKGEDVNSTEQTERDRLTYRKIGETVEDLA